MAEVEPATSRLRIRRPAITPLKQCRYYWSLIKNTLYNIRASRLSPVMILKVIQSHLNEMHLIFQHIESPHNCGSTEVEYCNRFTSCTSCNLMFTPGSELFFITFLFFLSSFPYYPSLPFTFSAVPYPLFPSYWELTIFTPKNAIWTVYICIFVQLIIIK